MSSLNRPHSALLVIDVQNGVVDGAFKRDKIVENIGTAIAKARAANVPIIWVQHSDEWMPIDSDDWQIVPELTPLETEARVSKLYRNSFEATNLEQLLTDLDVGHLYVCGAQTNNCVRFTCHGALDKGYDVSLIADAHTTSDYDWDNKTVSAATLVEDQNASFRDYELPHRKAGLITVDKIFAHV